jgi:hypothetical protein
MISQHIYIHAVAAAKLSAQAPPGILSLEPPQLASVLLDVGYEVSSKPCRSSRYRSRTWDLQQSASWMPHASTLPTQHPWENQTFFAPMRPGAQQGGVASPTRFGPGIRRDQGQVREEPTLEERASFVHCRHPPHRRQQFADLAAS